MNFIEIHNDLFVLQVKPPSDLREEEYLAWKQKWQPQAEKLQVLLNSEMPKLAVVRYEVKLEEGHTHQEFGFEKDDALIAIKVTTDKVDMVLDDKIEEIVRSFIS